MTRPSSIYHVTTLDHWLSQRDLEVYFSSGFSRDGFIHCCTREQLEGVIERYFSGKPNLILLHLDAHSFREALQYEVSTDGEQFPHLFCGIPKTALIEVRPLLLPP